MVALFVSRFADLDAATLYRLLKLRTDVFVVEQECAYPELDDRDTEPGTEHLWFGESSTASPVAYLRLLDDGAVRRIGRVVTDPAHRGNGLAARLVNEAISRCPGDVVLEAQTYLCEFYSDLGFTVTGDEYVEDGIPHIPMRRTQT